MNWQNISDIIFNLFVYGIFYYSVVLVWSYIFIGIFSIGETNRYVHKNSFTDYRLLAASPHAPSVTVIAPAHNEGKTIIENVRSLLSIYYSNLEVIFLNDGSTDDSLEKLITAYELEKVDFFVNYQIPTKEVIGVYKSRNPIYSKLVVVDKVNGGKADALNVGVNIATNDYLICIDVDCVLEEDALLKMVKPFLEETNTKVIASGGVIRIANSCIIEDGKLVKVKIPKQILPRMQSLEYIRSFILGRMAWSRLNGLLIVSGAFGAFNKEIVIKAGGYNHNTVGEDMELIVRMRRYMESKKLKYKVTYIPDPLCWTEAPVSFKILGRQRNRWARGTYETLKFHRAMFMNPKFHIMGLLSYPYWLFFEFCAPIIEFFGFAFFFLFAVLGMIDWWFFFIYLVFVLFFGYLYSVFAIYMEIITYNQYKKRSEITLLILTALTEPFYFHPFVVWSAVKGYFDLIRNNRGWGEMTRTGFEVYKPKLVVEKEEVDVLKERNWVYAKIHKIPVAFFNAIEEYSSYAIVLLLLLLASRIFELAHEVIQHSVPKLFSDVIGLGLVKDVSYFLSTGLLWFVPFLLLYLLNKKTARIFFVALSACLILIQISLSQYFITTSVPLGSDLWGYSWNDIKQTVGAAGVINAAMIIGISFLLAIIIFSFAYLPKKIKVNGFLAVILFVLFGSALWLNLISITDKWVPGQEYSNNLALNKSSFFLEASLQHFFPADKQPDIYTDAYSGNYASNENGTTSFNNGTFKYVDEVNYPFLHTIDSSADVLSPFFTIGKTPPNFVIIFVEGLGRAFTNKGGYLGNFTPFIDSLSEKSLYWENFLSEGGRTFAVLPSFLGSLPFGKNGFNELGENMPQHLSLLSLLKHNGYNTSFSYGGDSRFDNMNVYMQKNNVNSINDESSFPSGYIKMPPSQSGFSWGYGDKELFRRFLETKENPQQPFASVVLTVSTHSPFGINEQETYLQRFEQRMNELGFDDQKKREYRGYKNNYASILFMDDAVKNFIDQYKKRPDFNNTVFIITGDHRMPEIPMSTKLDRYHVPLVIYSPLIKRSAKFSSISTHFDVAPSLLMWLKKSYGLQIPSIVNFVGSGLDTARRFRNTHAYPLMQTKTDLIDFVKGEYMINGNNLFRINSNMDLTPVEDKVKFNELKAAFDLFKRKNEQFIQGKKLMPDSLVQKYLK